MATFRSVSSPKPIEIDKFIGINTAVGKTEIKPGEAIYMRNFRITKNYKAEKRQGYKTFIDYSNSLPVYGVWHGVLGGKEILITINNGKVYEYNFATETNTQIGTITNAECTIFYFGNKIYFLNGTDFKEYNGTTYQAAVPYEPIVARSTPPSGGGTLFEEINLLTGAKWQWFVGNGSSTVYKLSESNIDADIGNIS